MKTGSLLYNWFVQIRFKLSEHGTSFLLVIIWTQTLLLWYLEYLMPVWRWTYFHQHRLFITVNNLPISIHTNSLDVCNEIYCRHSYMYGKLCSLSISYQQIYIQNEDCRQKIENGFIPSSLRVPRRYDDHYFRSRCIMTSTWTVHYYTMITIILGRHNGAAAMISY